MPLVQTLRQKGLSFRRHLRLCDCLRLCVGFVNPDAEVAVFIIDGERILGRRRDACDWSLGYTLLHHQTTILPLRHPANLTSFRDELSQRVRYTYVLID